MKLKYWACAGDKLADRMAALLLKSVCCSRRRIGAPRSRMAPRSVVDAALGMAMYLTRCSSETNQEPCAPGR